LVHLRIVLHSTPFFCIPHPFFCIPLLFRTSKPPDGLFIVYLPLGMFISVLYSFFDCIDFFFAWYGHLQPIIERKWNCGGKPYLLLSKSPPVVAELPKVSSNSRVRTVHAKGTECALPCIVRSQQSSAEVLRSMTINSPMLRASAGACTHNRANCPTSSAECNTTSFSTAVLQYSFVCKYLKLHGTSIVFKCRVAESTVFHVLRHFKV
jgi:hypothetical protein